MLVPQSLALAELAGLPPYHGLYAAVLPPIAAALVASSPYLQTGPVALTSLLTLGVLSTVSIPGSAEYVGLAALLALMVGVIRLALGAIRAGWLAYLMSDPVVVGFTGAAALLIIGSQLPAALGVSSDADLSVRLWLALRHPELWQMSAIALSVVTILLVLGGRRLHPLFPGALVAVAIGIGANMLFGYGADVVGEIPSVWPPFSVALAWGAVPKLVLPALVIAVVGFAEPSAIARTYAAQDRTPWNPDRELVSQGLANVAAGISGGFPVGGSFTRTGLNRLAGGKTRWSGAVTGLAVLAFLPVAGIVSALPRAVLAGILIAAVANLVRIRRLADMRRYSVPQAAVAWMTFGLTLVLAPRIDLAVLGGIGMAILVHIWREQRVYVDAQFEDETGTLTLHPRGVLFFGSAPPLDRTLVEALAAHPDAERLTVDLHRLGRIDFTGAVALRRLAEDASGAGLQVRVTGVPAHTGGLLPRVFGSDSPFLTEDWSPRGQNR